MKVRPSRRDALELRRRQSQQAARREHAARGYVFDASPGNQEHIRLVMDIVARSPASMKPEKAAFLDAIRRVALAGVSIAEASDEFHVPPQAIQSILANISNRTPEQTYKKLSGTLRSFSGVSKNTDAVPPLDDIALQPTAASTRPPVLVGAPSPSRPVSPQPSASAILAMMDTSFLDAFNLAEISASSEHALLQPMSPQPEAPPASAMMDTSVSNAIGSIDFAAIAEHFNLDDDLVDLLKLDPYVAVPSHSQAPQLVSSPQRAPSTAPQAAPSAGSPARRATPSSSEYAQPVRADASVMPQVPDVSHLPAEIGLASVVTSPGAAAAQNYLSQHPGDGRVVFTTKQMIDATHKEFVAIASLSGHRVHAHKTSLFHAMVDTCQNVPLIAAAASKFVAPDALLGAMHALHATSPIDTFQWLCRPSTQSPLHPPGSDIVVTITDMLRPQDAMQLAPHRFAPHAQMYQQHPLPAAPQAMWVGNLVGAQPIPRY